MIDGKKKIYRTFVLCDCLLPVYVCSRLNLRIDRRNRKRPHFYRQND